MSFLKLQFIIGFLPLMFWACEGGNINQQDNKAKSGSVMNIKQGTVGKIGDFSIGVKSADSSTARVAVWNTILPQADRNDYGISFAFKSGELIPIGDNFHRVTDVSSGEIGIEIEPDKSAGVNLQKNALSVPDGGVLEMHGFAVEVVSIEAANGKDSAKIEIYPDDYPKQDLEKKNEIRQSTVSVGDEISVGDRKHKILAVYAAQGNRRGVVEIAL